MKKKLRVRKKVQGTPERPRLTIFRSNRNISAQIVDDVENKVLVQASSIKGEGKSNVEAAKKVGAEISQKAKEKNIESVVFDRNGFLFHGRIKALADAAREGGLKF
jgi:large subunit ribosomal protein L18